MKKEENIDRKNEQFERRDRELGRKERHLTKREGKLERKELEYNELVEEQKIQLEKISGLTAEQAKELLIRAMENEARYEGAKLIKRIENEAKEEADKKAKKILATAIQRYAADYVAERTVSVVQLPSEEMKGRIKADESTAPYRHGDYYYFWRYEAGKDYPVFSRKRESLDADEEVLLEGLLKHQAVLHKKIGERHPGKLWELAEAAGAHVQDGRFRDVDGYIAANHAYHREDKAGNKRKEHHHRK